MRKKIFVSMAIGVLAAAGCRSRAGAGQVKGQEDTVSFEKLHTVLEQRLDALKSSGNGYDDSITVLSGTIQDEYQFFTSREISGPRQKFPSARRIYKISKTSNFQHSMPGGTGDTAYLLVDTTRDERDMVAPGVTRFDDVKMRVRLCSGTAINKCLWDSALSPDQVLSLARLLARENMRGRTTSSFPNFLLPGLSALYANGELSKLNNISQ
jgi:hypothetical protein